MGFAPHSGWAVAIAVAEVDDVILVLARERVELVAAAAPESRQPYHAVEGTPIRQAARRLTAWSAAAERLATRAVREIVARIERDGYRAVGLGILDSSGRKGRTLEETLASHALIHTADGDHFRAAIAGAADRCGLPVVRVRARDLVSRAAATLRAPGPVLERRVRELGREMGPPWGADQKSAALLAWLVSREGDTIRPGMDGVVDPDRSSDGGA